MGLTLAISRADRLEHSGEELPELNTEHDAQADPDRQVAFKRRHDFSAIDVATGANRVGNSGS